MDQDKDAHGHEQEHQREHAWLVDQFEAQRSHLRAVAYRMLGSISEADDAVQESWLRLSRSDTSVIENIGGWLTTVVGRVCLDMLRSRQSRREESLDGHGPGPEPGIRHEEQQSAINPEDEALLADSVGLALLVVLDTLNPAERIAFVLHDLFDVPFDEIAPIVGRSSATTRQLASRARRRIQGVGTQEQADSDVDLTRQRAVVDAFLAASRAGDFDALLAVLDPDIVFRPDSAAMAMGPAKEIRGAQAVAKQFVGRAGGARPAVVDGDIGLLVAPGGQLFLVLKLTIVDGKLVSIDAIADPARLQQLDIRALDN
ncbi:MAG TPA: sigma-70 family RNA polymerase sigma factor [Ktedonobacterales bacterium]